MDDGVTEGKQKIIATFASFCLLLLLLRSFLFDRLFFTASTTTTTTPQETTKSWPQAAPVMILC